MSQCNCGPAKAVVSYGSIFEVQDPISMDWLAICGAVDYNGPQTSRGEIETTNLCSEAKEYTPDLKDNGSFTSTVQTMMGNPGQRLLYDNMDSTENLNFRLTLPDDGYGNGPVPISFKAWVQSFPISGSQGQVITSALSLRITGAIKIDYPNDTGKRIIFSNFLLNESSENDGSVAGVVSVTLKDDTFAGTNGAALAGVTFDSVPAGLTANAQKISDSTAIINFSGAAESHAPGDTARVGVSFGDAAFTTGPASEISGSTERAITINFVE